MIKRTATGIAILGLLVSLFRVVDTRAEVTRSEAQSAVSTEPLRDKPSVALMSSGITLTAVGALGLTAGFGVGAAALHFWAEADWNRSDSAAMLGFPAVTTLAIGSVLIAAGIPMFVIGKQRRERYKTLSAFVPTPSLADFVEHPSTRSFRLQWAFVF